MTKKNEQLAIMFADVVGSTRLYETLGDTQAHRQIGQCLAEIADIIHQYGGEVLETIGDGVLCRFSSADAAVDAACEMQESSSGKCARHPSALQVHIGIHYGPVIVEGNNVFGDTVNVAARLVAIARAGQIFTTEQTVNRLSPANKAMASEFDRFAVKGKREELTIYRIVWERDTGNVTSSMPISALVEPASWTLALRYQGLERRLTATSGAILVGRSSQCDIVIHSPVVSRLHARFEHRRGKIILIDQSTNGTYVRTEAGVNVYLHREDFFLSGAGTISLGTPVSERNEHLIYFKATPDKADPRNG